MNARNQSLLRFLLGLALWSSAIGATAPSVWDGGHPSQSHWSNAQNWNPNGAPANDGTADLLFTGSIRLTPDANTPWSVNSITFDSAAGAFTLIGSALTIDGTSVTHAISNLSPYAQTINNALIVAASQTWSATTGGLAFNGAVTLGSNVLTLAGNSAIGMTGAISGTGGLVKSGTGTLTLAGANTYSGGTTVSSGTLLGDSTSLQGNITNQATVRFNQAASGTYAGVISGAGALIKENAGTLTLTGASTYTGATTISGGTLALGSADALHDSTAVSVASGSALQLAAGPETVGSITGTGNILLGSFALTTGGANASTSFEGAISGTGSLAKTGTGTLTLTGANTYSGGTTVSGGALAGTSTSLQGNITNNATVVFDQAFSGSYGGGMSGSGALTKQGAGTLTLAGTNSFTGATQITGGTLLLGAANALSDSTAVTIGSGAGLQLGGGAETVGSIAGGGSIELGSFTLTAGGTGNSTTFSGTIAGTGALEKTGAGTLALTGANTFSGGTTVSAGTLQGTTTSLQGNIVNQAAVEFNQTGSGTYGGVISGAGAVTKSGSGTVTLTGANTFTGATTIAGGTLALGGDNVLSAASALTLGPAAELSLGGYSAQIGALAYHTSMVDFGTAATANFLLFGGGGPSTGTLTINNFSASDGDAFAFQSGAPGVTASFVEGVYFYGIGGGMLGATNQTFAGYSGIWDLIVPGISPFTTWDGGGGANTWSTSANWSGDTAPVSGYTLKLAFDGTARLTPVMDGSYNVNTVRFDAGAGAFSISASGGGSKLTFGGAVPGIIQLSANAQTINVPLVFNGTTIVETTGAGDLTLAGVISGTGGLTKLGGDTLVLAGGNTYTGVTTIDAGTVVVSHSTGLGSTASGTTVSAGATLSLQNGISVGAEALALDGTLRNTSGANTYGGAVSGSGAVVVDAGTLTLGGAGANTYTGLTTINAGTLELAKTGGSTAVAGNLVIGSGTGAATARLAGDNQIADTSLVTLAGGGTPVFNLAGRTETIGSLASSNPAASVLLGNGGSLTTGGNGASTTFAGVISEAGSLTKAGTGTFALSGANTYSGATTVAAGTLVLQNATALGTTAGGTTVASGATLRLENNIAIGAEALSLAGTLRSATGTNAFGGAISGTGNVVLDAGTLQLGGSAANTFTGTTTVNSGTLELNKTAGVTAVSGNLLVGNGSGAATVRLLAANQIANTSAVTLAATGAVGLDLNGKAETIGSLASANPAATVQLGAATLATGANASSTTFAGVISGTGGLTKEGSGTFTLTGTNTYTGTTTVSGGTLTLGASDVIADASNLSLGAGTTLALNGIGSERVGTLSFSSATIDLGAAGTPNAFLFDSVGAFSGALAVANWTSGSDVFGVATNTVSQSFLDSVFFSNINVGIGAVLSVSPVAVGSYGNFYTLSPIPTFIWSGAQSGGPAAGLDDWSKANNWAGGIAPAMGAQKAIVMAGTVKTTNDMNGAYQINSLLFRSDAAAFVITSSTGDTLTIGGGGINNQSTFLQTLAVPVALSASQTWTAGGGNLAITGGTVLNDGNTLTIAGGGDTSITGVIGGGAGGLVKTGTGTLTLGGANTYTGGTTLNAGVVAVSSDANLGAASGALTFGGGTLRATAGLTSDRAIALNAGGGTVDSNGVNVTLTGTLAGAGGLTKVGAGTLTLTGTNTYAGGTTVAAGTLQGNTASLQGSILNQAALVFDQASSGVFAGVISGTGSLTKSNTGTLTLTGANTYTGDTFITAGTLALGANNVLPGTTALTISSGATLDVAGFTQTIASLNGTGQVAMGGGLLQVGATDAASSFGGTISGPGVLEKIGSGELVFDAALNFAGELRLTGGTVTLNGADVTLGTLRISGDTILDFGNSASVLSATNVIIENNATLLIKRWQSFQNFFYALGSFFGLNTSTNQTKPVTPGVSGVAPQNQIAFIGTTPDWTHWDTNDRQITPVPEPAAYGFVIVAGFLGLTAWWRWKNRPPASLATPELGERVPVRRGTANSPSAFATHSGGVPHASNRHTGRWPVLGIGCSHGQGIPGVYCRRFTGGATRLSRSSRAPRPRRRAGRGSF